MSRIVGVVGSYRKNGIAAAAVEAVLAGAEEEGATTHLYRLAECNLSFCNNCRNCAQEPGPERGRCGQLDDLEGILREIEAADSVVLGSPINYGGVTAVFRKFMERLTGFYYWPWGKAMPKLRQAPSRKAVLVASSGMPGFFIPLFTDGARTLRWTAKILGAKPVSTLWLGRYGWRKDCRLLEEDLERARNVGRALA
jgi:NAD(P)H-dependent FMN reductase